MLKSADGADIELEPRHDGRNERHDESHGRELTGARVVSDKGCACAVRLYLMGEVSCNLHAVYCPWHSLSQHSAGCWGADRRRTHGRTARAVYRRRARQSANLFQFAFDTEY